MLDLKKINAISAKIKLVILLRFPLPDIPVNIVWGRKKHYKANCSCETLLSLFNSTKENIDIRV